MGTSSAPALCLALGPLAEALNDGEVQTTLGGWRRLARSAPAELGKPTALSQVYQLTPAGRERVTEWLEDTAAQPPPPGFH